MQQFESSDLAGQRLKRIENLNKLTSLGINPYPSRSNREKTNNQLRSDFNKLENTNVLAAGRLVSLREHGKLVFGDIEDITGKIQMYIREDDLETTNKDKQTIGFKELNLIDIGDFIEVTGTLTKTKAGEISILVKELRLLTKAIRPLPVELENKEDRFRRRYLDMALHPEVRSRFERRAAFWQATRDFLNSKGFVEVNIPVLEHTTGGADAKPFETHYDALDQDFYLRISHELPLKRLLGGGFEKVYDIGPRFRNEGFSDEHLPEHIAMEWYWAFADYREGMQLTQDMFKFIMQKVYGKLQFNIRGFDVNLDQPWKEIWFADIIKERFNVDIFADSLETLSSALKNSGVDLGADTNKNRVIDSFWKQIRKTIAGPAFLLGVPKFMSPLSKVNKDNPLLVDRFQPIIAGSEMANGYSELNDPQDQLQRFIEQQELRESGDDEAQMLDIDFVEMLEYGMPPAVGYGMSERVFWMFENVTAKEGVPFPQLKAEIDNNTRKIYPQILKYIEPETIKLDLPDVSDLSKDNLIQIDEQVQQKWPSLSLGYARISGVKIEKENPELEKLKQELLSQIKSLTKEDLNALPELISYRKLYKETGIDWHSRRPSPEALLRRITQGKDLYNINTLVDAYNLIVMKYHVSIGAFDADKLGEPVKLVFAEGTEQIQLLGDEAPTQIKKDELCYFDNQGPYNLDLNYRDADRTKVTLETKNVVINVEGVYDITPEQVKRSLQEAVAIITRFCGGKVEKVGIIR